MKKITLIIVTILLTGSYLFSQDIDYTKDYTFVYKQLKDAEMYDKIIELANIEIEELTTAIEEDYNNNPENYEDLGSSLEDILNEFVAEYQKDIAFANLNMGKIEEAEESMSFFFKYGNDLSKRVFGNELLNDAKPEYFAKLNTDTLLKYIPDFNEELVEIGFLLYLEEEYDEARTKIEKSITYEPNYFFAHLTLGLIEIDKGGSKNNKHVQKALEICNKNLQSEKNIPNYLHRAMVYEAMEEYDKAVADCNSALTICDNYEYAIRIKNHLLWKKNQILIKRDESLLNSCSLKKTLSISFCNLI